MSTYNLDPVTLEVIWNGLLSVTDECFAVLQRSAFSTNIKERHDHSISIMDRSGRLIAQSDKSLPIHIASMTGLVGVLLGRYGDRIGPDDIFVANDPYAAGGTHLPDINMATPIFTPGGLVGFVCNIAHHADVGGAFRGSMSGGLKEIYQEGLRIPLVRLYRGEEVQQDVLDLLLLNMRLPRERRGDLNAQVAACRLGIRRVVEMFERHGAESVVRAFDDIVLRTEERFRRVIATLPDGSWAFEDFMDDDGMGNQDIRIALSVNKRGTHITFDFTGSDRQAAGNINLTLNAVQSSVAYAMKALLDPEVANNQGIIDSLDIIAPSGTIVQCEFPAAVALRANTCQRVVDVVCGALCQAIPERCTGASNGANTSIVFAGSNPAAGGPYIYLETLGGGMGARATHDGKDGVQVNITNTSNLPIEAIEMEYPLRVEEYSLVADSGGAGRQRGGMGLRRAIRPIGHNCEFSGVGERFRRQPWGVLGGGGGKPGRFFIKNDDGTITDLPEKISGVVLRPTQVVIAETPGAGGYGDPLDRSQADLAGDRRSGKFSDAYLRWHYQSEKLKMAAAG